MIPSQLITKQEQILSDMRKSQWEVEQLLAETKRRNKELQSKAVYHQKYDEKPTYSRSTNIIQRERLLPSSSTILRSSSNFNIKQNYSSKAYSYDKGEGDKFAESIVLKYLNYKNAFSGGLQNKTENFQIPIHHSKLKDAAAPISSKKMAVSPDTIAVDTTMDYSIDLDDTLNLSVIEEEIENKSSIRNDPKKLCKMLKKKDELIVMLKSQLVSNGVKPIEIVVGFEKAEENLKGTLQRLMSGDETAEAEFNKWDEYVRNHPEFKAKEEKKQTDWYTDNFEVNLHCLYRIKSIVPPNICQTTYAKLEKRLPPTVCKRVWMRKALWLVRYDKDVIAKAHIADLQTKFSTQGLDEVELRAVWASLPDKFENDNRDLKAAWKASILVSLQSKALPLPAQLRGDYVGEAVVDKGKAIESFVSSMTRNPAYSSLLKAMPTGGWPRGSQFGPYDPDAIEDAINTSLVSPFKSPEAKRLTRSMSTPDLQGLKSNRDAIEIDVVGSLDSAFAETTAGAVASAAEDRQPRALIVTPSARSPSRNARDSPSSIKEKDSEAELAPATVPEPSPCQKPVSGRVPKGGVGLGGHMGQSTMASLMTAIQDKARARRNSLDSNIPSKGTATMNTSSENSMATDITTTTETSKTTMKKAPSGGMASLMSEILAKTKAKQKSEIE